MTESIQRKESPFDFEYMEFFKHRHHHELEERKYITSNMHHTMFFWFLTLFGVILSTLIGKSGILIVFSLAPLSPLAVSLYYLEKAWRKIDYAHTPNSLPLHKHFLELEEYHKEEEITGKYILSKMLQNFVISSDMNCETNKKRVKNILESKKHLLVGIGLLMFSVVIRLLCTFYA